MPHACPIRRKEYKEENRERILEYQKKYYQDNKERIAKRDKEYRENNKGRKCSIREKEYNKKYS